MKIILALILALAPGLALAESVATVFSIEGEVQVRVDATADWISATNGMEIPGTGTIRTLAQSRAGITFGDGTFVRLNQNSEISFADYKASKNEKGFFLRLGELFMFSRKPRELPVVETYSVSAAIRGTELNIKAQGDRTEITVIEGRVQLTNSAGELALTSGQSGEASSGVAPTRLLQINLADTIQWTLYYPALTSFSEAERRQAQGDKKLLYSAIAQLSSGGVEQAEPVLQSIASSGDPTLEPIALAQLTVVALSRGDRELADQYLARAEAIDSSAAEVLIARSYVEQSRLSLGAARESARRAVGLHPQNRKALGRLAELELSFGETDAAFARATELFQLDSESVASLTTLGFAYLARFEPQRAQEMFERALTIEAGQGLSHLGLGLALINLGQLEAGRLELTRAAVVEPNVAIFRSYLGKAYFEEDNSAAADHEYTRAITLDPLDPTPYLYRSYNRLAQNRVVEALSDVEQSIELNNNRALYRSSLLLDQDTSVRSAGLAQIFRSLGFERAATVEAIKSINRNYANYSAHRFLSESYDTIQTSDASVSELSVANLLSPLSFNLFNNPSSASSTNEYNALFDRPDNRTSINLNAQTLDDTVVAEAFHAGRTQKLGYLFGFESAFADGSKRNNYLRDNRLRAAGQYQISPDDKLIVEGRYTYQSIMKDSEAIDDVKFEILEGEIGYHHQLDSNSGVLLQVAGRDTRNHLGSSGDQQITALDIISSGSTLATTDTLLVNEFSRDDVRDGRISAQYYTDQELFSVVFGGQFYHSRPRRNENSTVLDDEFSLFSDLDYRLTSNNHQNLNSQDLYLYPTIHLADLADLNLGLSHTDLELERTDTAPFVDQSFSKSQWNPKVGLTVYPDPNLTLKAAYFEGLRKSALEDVGTIEPTLIGGFNQVYTDLAGTESRNFGGGLDYKLPNNAYIGLEYLRRQLKTPDSGIGRVISIDFDELTIGNESLMVSQSDLRSEQDIFSAYYYQILSSQLVATLDYAFYDTQFTDPEVDQQLELHRAATTVRYFSELGFYTFATATWREQNRKNSFFLADGRNDFWLIDLGLGYRIPKRQGNLELKFANILDRDFSFDQSAGFEEFVAPEIAAILTFSLNF